MSCAIWTKLNFNSTASAHIIDFQNENFQFGILAKNFLPRPPFAGCETFHCAFFLLLLLRSLLLHWSSPRDSTFAFLFAGLCDVSSQPTEGKLRWEKLLTKLLYKNRPLVVLCGWEKRRDERDGREREELVAEVRSCLALYVLKLTIFFPPYDGGKEYGWSVERKWKCKARFSAGGKSENTMSEERESWMGESVSVRQCSCTESDSGEERKMLWVFKDKRDEDRITEKMVSKGRLDCGMRKMVRQTSAQFLFMFTAWQSSFTSGRLALDFSFFLFSLPCGSFLLSLIHARLDPSFGRNFSFSSVSISSSNFLLFSFHSRWFGAYFKNIQQISRINMYPTEGEISK